MEKNNILIIQQHQFGYLTDSYKWCEYLKSKYNITLLCYDMGKERIPMEGIRIKYFNTKGNRYTRGIRFLLICLWNILRNNGTTIIVYFKKCEWLKRLLPFKKMIVDIRTLSVSPNVTQRNKHDVPLRNACRYFDVITVISEGIKQKLNLPNKNIKILPLGSDIISTQKKSYLPFKLFYVGTLSNREMEKTIDGFELFIKNNPTIEASYDIVGDGVQDELRKLIEYTNSKKKDIASKITFHGRLPYNQLQPFFDNCNIGISFVPITDYFDCQPPTKTFEYILSGLYTIATATKSNKEVITSDNGILINDTPNAFANALECIAKHYEDIKEENIRKSLANYTWDKIVSTQLEPLLQ